MYSRFLPAVLAIVFGLVVPVEMLAQAVDVPDCLPGVDLTCGTDINAFIRGRLIDNRTVFNIFAAVLFAMCVFYGIKLAVEARDENALQQAQAAYFHAVGGVVVVGGALLLAQAFGTVGTPIDNVPIGTVAGGPGSNSILWRAISFMVTMVSFVLLANIVIQGIRLIIGIEQGQTDKARANFIQSMIGAAVVILAVPILRLVTPGAFNPAINAEIVGIANFLGTIFGALCVIAFIVAGILYIVSVNDSLRDRARNLMLATIVALVIVIAALAVIQILIPEPGTLPNSLAG